MRNYIKKGIKNFKNLTTNKSVVHVVMLLLLCTYVIALSSSCSVLNSEKTNNLDISTSHLYDDSDESIAQDTEQATGTIDTPSSTPMPKPTKKLDKELTITSEPEPEPELEPAPIQISIPEPTPTPILEHPIEPTKKPTQVPTPTPTLAPTQIPISTPNPVKEISPTPITVVADSKYSKEARKILEKIITTDMTDVEKIKVVHDYIVVNTKYDIEGLEQGDIPRSAYTVEGVLVKGKAVCQGYAEAFQLFMELLNIESKMVVGSDLISGLGHAWNMVCIDDKWHHIDVTWDDPVPDQGERVQYKYFLIRDDDISKDHKWVIDDYPKSNSSDYLYYIYKDFIVDSIDNVEEKFMEQYDSGLREITLLYPEEGMPDFSFMHNYDYLWKKDDGGGLKINYTYYPIWRLGDYYVLTVFME